MEIFSYDITISWIIGSLVMFLGYLYSTWTYDHFKKLGIRGPKPWPLLGNIPAFYFKGFRKFQLDMHKQYGPVFGVFEGRQPALYVADTALMKEMMVKEFATFCDKSDRAKYYPMQYTLLFGTGQTWRRLRALLAPAFSSSKLRQMTSAIDECADVMVGHLKEKDDKKEVDIREVTNAFTLDAICQTLFGIKVDSQRNRQEPIIKHSQNVFKVGLTYHILSNWLPAVTRFLQKTLSFSLAPEGTMEFFADLIDETMERRRADSHADTETTVDLLHLMMKANEIEPDKADIEENKELGLTYDSTSYSKKAMSKDELLANSIDFISAGNETTATTLAYLTYSLATNPGVHQRVTKEIDEIIGKETVITFEKCARFYYLEQCIQETLRMYPPDMRIERACSKDFQFKDVKILKGTKVIISPYAVHHDPKNWPKPEIFDPDRFNPEAKAGRDPVTWIPFGFGPRNCIGFRLAMLNTKISAAKMLQHFIFKTCPSTEIPLAFKKEVMLRPKNPIKLAVEQRI